MAEIACTHSWEPIVMFGGFAKSCDLCGRWTQIPRREFARRFGRNVLREAIRVKRRQLESLQESPYWNDLEGERSCESEGSELRAELQSALARE